jgi:hypothetical protein
VSETILESDLVHTLSAIQIGEFASRRGAHEKDVESFLYTVGQPGTEEGALLNLYYQRLFLVRFTRFILTPIDKPSPIHNFPNCP